MIIGQTKYGPVQTFRRHDRPRNYVCACCVMSVGVPQDDGRYCSTCRSELEKQAKGEPSDWLKRCKDARDELREIDRLYPAHLDYHAWRYLHDDGQDYDEMMDSAATRRRARLWATGWITCFMSVGSKGSGSPYRRPC